MYLSAWNTVKDAADWLTQNTDEKWTCMYVLSRLAAMQPKSIKVYIGPGSISAKNTLKDSLKYFRSDELLFQVTNATPFLEELLLSDSFESARAYSSCLIDSSNTIFHNSSLITATSIRLSKDDIFGLASSPTLDNFGLLVSQLKAGKHPTLAALIKRPKRIPLNFNNNQRRLLPSEGERNLKTHDNPYTRNEKIVARKANSNNIRAEPKGGDQLTELVWKICYAFHDEGKRVKPSTIMKELKELAIKSVKPLVSVISDGVKYECGNGDEKELNPDSLRKRISEWRKASKIGKQ